MQTRDCRRRGTLGCSRFGRGQVNLTPKTAGAWLDYVLRRAWPLANVSELDLDAAKCQPD
jgi:hypothetical protein